jgi:glycosyltransferase involved in cell wall biosynthesis
LTSVHNPRDNRIFEKQAKSLSEAGFDICLVAPHENNFEEDGVKVISVDKKSTRTARFILTVKSVLKKAIDIDADVYHLHDPELIPAGLYLKWLGKKVIYDVHEDYSTSIMNKSYLPKCAKKFLSSMVDILESFSENFLSIVVAEKYYEEKFKKTTRVLNYPSVEKIKINKPKTENARNKIIYTGNVTVSRGALIHANVVNVMPNIEVHFVGKCDSKTAKKIKNVAGSNKKRIKIYGLDRYVPFEDIVKYYRQGQWLAGIALFPFSKHYNKKELTKFFEYMAAGIPIVASDFVGWRRLIKKTETGLLVDQNSFKEIKLSLKYLKNNPHERYKMGKKGIKAVKTTYNWKSQKENLIKLYNKIK